jgi:hypothetical protein
LGVTAHVMELISSQSTLLPSSSTRTSVRMGMQDTHSSSPAVIAAGSPIMRAIPIVRQLRLRRQWNRECQPDDELQGDRLQRLP